MTATGAAPGAPVARDGRAVAPDLARGLMLLLIALANVPWFLYGASTALTSAHRTGATGLDAAWQVVAIVAVDGRSYPLFAFLFGYGIWQSYARQWSSGVDERAARRALQRRHCWLIVFGAVHAALLWYGDVLGAYGLVGLVVVWLFLRRTTTILLVWAGILTGLLAAGAALLLAVGALVPPDVTAEVDLAVADPQLAGISPYLDSVLPRLEFWLPQSVLQGLVGLVVPVAVLLGIACARSRVLEAPASHRRALGTTAVVGIALGWAGAVPTLLVHLGVWDVAVWTPALLHLLTGLFAPLLCAWGLGLGGVLDQWQAALVAVATWLVTLVVAVLLERAGRRGPAERALRALSGRRVESVAR
jgi:uncharacterized protein